MAKWEMTIGEIEEYLSGKFAPITVRTWWIRRLVERDLLDEPPRAGAYRVFTPNDLPQIEEALRRAGHLPPRTKDGREAEVLAAGK
jgi:hypothetical protein